MDAELSFADRYAAFKEWMSAWTGMSEDLLHVHMGLLIFVFFAVVLRRRMHSAWPLTIVAAFALLNEIVDSFDPQWLFGPSALDAANTLLWPTVLFVVARRKRVAPPLSGSQAGSRQRAA